MESGQPRSRSVPVYRHRWSAGVVLAHTGRLYSPSVTAPIRALSQRRCCRKDSRNRFAVAELLLRQAPVKSDTPPRVSAPLIGLRALPPHLAVGGARSRSCQPLERVYCELSSIWCSDRRAHKRGVDGRTLNKTGLIRYCNGHWACIRCYGQNKRRRLVICFGKDRIGKV